MYLEKEDQNMRPRRLIAKTSTIILLAAIAAVGQFASNIYIPSLPSVATDLNISHGLSQTTFSVFLAAFALTQLIIGPIADQYGRKPVLLIGLTAFLGGTFLCSLAVDYTSLITGRIIQGSGAAAGIVISRAVTRDSFDGVELAKMVAAITIAFALVPGLTPLLGGVVEQTAGWRATFTITAVLGIILIFIVVLWLPETLATPRRISAYSEVEGYAIILCDRVFLSNVLVVACAFASMSTFFAGAPAVLIGTLGISPIEFGFYPPIAVSGFVIGGIITRQRADVSTPRNMSVLGTKVMLLGALLIFIPPAFGLLDKFVINGAMVVHVTGLGILLPASIAAALQRFPERAGAAAAMQGFLQMSGGAIGAGSAAIMLNTLGTISFPTVMLCATTLSWLTAIFFIPRAHNVTGETDE